MAELMRPPAASQAQLQLGGPQARSAAWASKAYPRKTRLRPANTAGAARLGHLTSAQLRVATLASYAENRSIIFSAPPPSPPTSRPPLLSRVLDPTAVRRVPPGLLMYMPLLCLA